MAVLFYEQLQWHVRLVLGSHYSIFDMGDLRSLMDSRKHSLTQGGGHNDERMRAWPSI